MTLILKNILEQVVFDGDMRGGKSAAEDTGVAKKPTGKEMFLSHLVGEDEEGGDSGKKVLVLFYLVKKIFFVVVVALHEGTLRVKRFLGAGGSKQR